MTPGVLLVALLGATPLPPEADGTRDPFSLTLQGAASLGTYEAGVSWTVVQLIHSSPSESERRLSMQAFTGSSAGSINAVLAGALWCESEDSPTNLSVDDNLLRNAWVSVGLDALLPGDPKRYSPGDGLFASTAFTAVVEKVGEQIFSGKAMHFRPGCRVPVGFTVTRVAPEVRTVSGLTVHVQRAVLPLLFEVDSTGAPRFVREPVPPRLDTADTSLALAEAVDAHGLHVPADELFQALLASAAFPLAFGARPLCECRLECGNGQVEVTAASCPGPDPSKMLSGLTCSGYSARYGGAELKLCRGNYVDGGFLDNAPVGLAIDQAAAFSPPRALRPLSAIFVDPGARRPAQRPDISGELNAQGVTDVVRLANDLVNTARERELVDATGATAGTSPPEPCSSAWPWQ